MIEETTIRSLHVESLRHDDLSVGHDDHALFQASTVSALLDGAYDGDLTFAELANEGDTGIGTLNGLDGEMIAIEGRFYRADVNGEINEIDPGEKTPFAVMARFEPESESVIDETVDLAGLERLLDHDRSEAPVAVFRIEGEFRRLKARSVPKQLQPYRHLSEVVADQNVFELGPTVGTLIGFRFPTWTEGVEIGGYHFHYADTERRRGGHVLDLEMDSGKVLVQYADDLHVELPPGLDLDSPDLTASTHEAISMVEHSG